MENTKRVVGILPVFFFIIGRENLDDVVLKIPLVS